MMVRFILIKKSIAGDETYKNKIGYMPQIGRYPENMSIIQVIDMIKSIRQFDGQTDEELWDAFGSRTSQTQKNANAIWWNYAESECHTSFFIQSRCSNFGRTYCRFGIPLASEILREKIIMERQKVN